MAHFVYNALLTGIWYTFQLGISIRNINLIITKLENDPEIGHHQTIFKFHDHLGWKWDHLILLFFYGRRTYWDLTCFSMTHFYKKYWSIHHQTCKWPRHRSSPYYLQVSWWNFTIYDENETIKVCFPNLSNCLNASMLESWPRFWPPENYSCHVTNSCYRIGQRGVFWLTGWIGVFCQRGKHFFF